MSIIRQIFATRRRDLYEWGGLTALVLLSLAFWGSFQEMYIHHLRHGDTRIYLKMALQHIHGESLSERAPFIYRQLLPWLAALFAGNGENLEEKVLTSFKIISITSSVLTVYLVLLFLRFFIHDWRLRLGLVALYLLHPYTGVRLSFWLPMSTDAFGMLCITGILVLCQQIRSAPTQANLWIALSAAVIFIGVLARSSFIVCAAMVPLCIAHSPQAHNMTEKVLEKMKHFSTPWLLVPLATGLVAYFYIRYVVVVTGVFGSEIHGNALRWAIKNGYSTSIGEIIYGLYNHWGPILVLLLWRFQAVAGFLARHWHLLFFLLFNMTLCLAANDYRFLVHVFPIYLLLLGVVIQANFSLLCPKKWLLCVLTIAQLITQRAFWAMPNQFHGEANHRAEDLPLAEPFLFTPFTSEYDWWDTYLLHTSRGVYFEIVTAQHLVFSLIMLYFLFRLKK